LQPIKDPCGTSRFPKQADTFLQETNSCQIENPQVKKELNNKIHTTCFDLYRKFFSKTDSFKSLPQDSQIPVKSSGKFLARSNGWIWSYDQ
jgi:hypothetical protein